MITLITTSTFRERDIVFATPTEEFHMLITQDLDLHPKFRCGDIYYEKSFLILPR